MIQNLDSFFVATGTNLGNRLLNLSEAKVLLQNHFTLIAESRIYESAAVDYLNQPDFYNQVLEFEISTNNPNDTMLLLLQLEKEMGRSRLTPKGPRLIDLDILFWGLTKLDNNNLQIPHPRLFERSFVVLPLIELPGFQLLKKHFHFKLDFHNQAKALLD